MAFEFDLDYMNECMEPFALSCPENEIFVEKFEEICRIYHQTVDNVVDEVVSIMQNEKKSVVNLQVIEELQKKFESNALKEAATPKSAKKSRKPLTDRAIIEINKNFDEAMELSDNLETTVVSNSQSLTGRYAQFSPFGLSPANLNFQKRKDSGNIVRTLKGDKFEKRNAAATLPTIGSLQLISRVPHPYYGGDKSSSVIEAKIARFTVFANTILETYSEISNWGDPLKAGVEPVYTYGQIVHDGRDGERFGENTVSIMIDNEDGSMIHLDFSKLADDVTLFPGQLIAVRGTNETGTVFHVDRIFAPPVLLPKRVERDVSTEIWFAAGPFTSGENCAYEQLCDLLNAVELAQPAWLVLTGPFVDRKNNYIQKPEFTLTYDILLEDLFSRIEERLAKCRTEVIVQPAAVREMCVPPVFPASPFVFLSKRKFSKKFHFVPDPCVIRICNDALTISITSSEIIAHISKEEFHRSLNQENFDRVARLSSHLLSQRSMYPLEPVQIPSSMDDVIDVCQLSTVPNIFVTPCILAPHVKKIDETVFINPSNLAKGASGTFVKAVINIPAGSLSVADYSHFEIVKI